MIPRPKVFTMENCTLLKLLALDCRWLENRLYSLCTVWLSGLLTWGTAATCQVWFSLFTVCASRATGPQMWGDSSAWCTIHLNYVCGPFSTCYGRKKHQHSTYLGTVYYNNCNFSNEKFLLQSSRWRLALCLTERLKLNDVNFTLTLDKIK